MTHQQVKIARLLSCVQMCKFFGDCGLRTLFVLYLVGNLEYSDWKAFSLNALFCGLTELGAIAGGFLADRYWNLRKSILIGGLLLSIGTATLIYAPLLFLSLSLIITGGSLFSSNITALLGLNYKENDSARQGAFTRFYMMQNLGALTATLLCALIATQWGFHFGFLTATCGMVLANIILFLGLPHISQLEKDLSHKQERIIPFALLGLLFILAWTSSLFAEFLLPILPVITGTVLIALGIYLLNKEILEKKVLIKLFLYLAGLVLFFAIEDQIASSLILFAQRETDRVLLGWTIPSAFITGMNPIVILLLGGWVARKKIIMLTPFALTATSFGLLALFTLLQFKISILGVVGVVATISLAELMIAPMVLSFTSEIACKSNPGIIMGVVSVAFSLAFQFSGLLSQIVSIEEGVMSSQIYGMGFAFICGILFFGGIVIYLLIRRYSREDSAICQPA